MTEYTYFNFPCTVLDRVGLDAALATGNDERLVMVRYKDSLGQVTCPVRVSNLCPVPVKPSKPKTKPKFIYVASPLSAPTPEGVVANMARAGTYCLTVLEAGHVPYAPHLLLTRFLDDSVPAHRAMGLEAGLAELRLRDELWFWGYPTAGMKAEIALALSLGKPVRMYDDLDASSYLGDLVAMGADGSLKVSRVITFPSPTAYNTTAKAA
jgi:hypothetical protein